MDVRWVPTVDVTTWALTAFFNAVVGKNHK